MSKLAAIQSERIFYHFEQISNIPRGSKNNTAISQYLLSFAKERGFTCWTDEAENVVIVKEASKGYEGKPTVMIQGHMDMVCDKELNCTHDFEKEPLDLQIEGDYISAKGTTLGGDNGIAIAYALAILEDDQLIHPRLEMIFTTDEEIGMDGAIALDTSKLKGTYLLNVDSEEEGILLTSSAGGLASKCSLPIDYEERTGTTYQIEISGLQGGHSGVEIHKNRTNAAILMGRLLFELEQEVTFHLIDLKSGKKDNAIPRDAVCKIIVEKEQEAMFLQCLQKHQADYERELLSGEKDLTIAATVIGNEISTKVFSKQSFEKVLQILLYMPNGVQTFSTKIENLVESSLNLGVIEQKGNQLSFQYAVRSSIESYKAYMSKKIEYFITQLGGVYEATGDYAPWEYKQDSKLRELMVQVYEQFYGEKPKVEAVHAGLECGIFAGKMKGLDMISFGPNMLDIHTPQERLSISSARRVYEYIIRVLEAMCTSETI